MIEALQKALGESNITVNNNIDGHQLASVVKNYRELQSGESE